MMLLYIDLTDGTNIAGRSSEMDLADLMDLEWLRLGDPTVTAVTTSPIYNNEGLIQMMDGTWQVPNTIRDPSKVNMVVQGSKFLAYDVEDMIIAMDKVRSIRPMKRDEVERYDAALKAAKRANTKLEIGSGLVNV